MKVYRVVNHDPDVEQTLYKDADEAMAVAVSDLREMVGDLARVGAEIGIVIKVEEMSEEDFSSLPEL